MLVFSSQSRGDLRARLLGLATLVMLAPLTGLLIARESKLAWVLLGSVAALAFVESSPIYWAVGAIAAATLSRVAVAMGAPNFLNFVHFPLVLGGFAVALLKKEKSSAAKAIRNGLWVFLAVNFVSWLVNDGEFLRPVLNWLVITEPFLLLYMLVATPVTERTTALLYKFFLAICFIQVPLGVWQRVFVSHGNPDLVQGTFIGSGTGAHVAGAVTMLGVVALLCQGAASKAVRVRIFCFAAVVPLFGLAVIADAKQSILCFIPGLVFAIMSVTKIRPLAIVLPATFLGLVLYAAFHFYAPLQKIGQHGLVSGGLQGKTFGFLTILSSMADKPAGLFLGLGPGNTVSRVAVLTPDAQLDATSSLAALGLKTAPLTKELLNVTHGNWLWKSSSAWSPECSWFGLIGDLGFVGVGVYLWILGIAWVAVGRRGGWLSSSAKGSLIGMALLGGIYTWLEEPAFTLMAALLIGLAMLPRVPARGLDRVQNLAIHVHEGLFARSSSS